MKLSLYEQETIILYNQAEATAEVYTHDSRLLEKLRRLAEKYPDQIVKKDRQTFTVPKRCVSVREPYSNQRRKAASEWWELKRKQPTKAIVTALLKNGRAHVSGLHSEKTGKTYDATVVLEDDGQYANFKLEFDQQKGGKR